MTFIARMRPHLLPRQTGMILLLWLVPWFAQAATQVVASADSRHLDWQWTQFTTGEGLPQNSVTAIAQTPDGYLWIGTQGGLARFDGVRFTLFDIASTPLLGENRVLSLFVAADGDLWVSTTNGGVLRMRDGEFTSNEDYAQAPKGRVWSMIEDQSGSIWFAGHNLVRYADGVFRDLNLREGIPNAANAWSVLSDHDGSVWVGTAEGLGRIVDESWTKIDHLPNLATRDVRFLGKDPLGTVWTCGIDWIADLTHDRYLSVESQADLHGRVYSATVDRRGDYWIGGSRGLFRRHGSSEVGGAYDPFQFEHVELPTAAGQTTVRSLFEDREGNLWIGTDGQGLFRLREAQFKSFSTPQDRLGLFPAFLASGVDGRLWYWAGGHGHLAYLTGEQWTTVSFPNGYGQTRSAAMAADGRIWTAHDEGILSNYMDGRFESFEHGQGRIFRMAENADGVLWLATAQGLATCIDGAVERLPDGGSFEPFNERTVLSPSPSGTIWIGHEDTVTGYRDGDFVQYSLADAKPHGGVRSIHESLDGTVWVSTYGGGLVRFIGKELTRYTVQDGLPDNSLGKIIEDEEGALWINSNRGVFRVHLDDLRAFAEGQLPSLTCLLLQTGEANSAEGAVAPNGSFWFPTLTGLVQINPKGVETNDVPPDVVIEELVADRVRHDTRMAVQTLPGDGGLEIKYTAPSFVEPNNVRFRYMLDGFDDRFIEAGTERTARYTNIPPGQYKFKVMASNESGIWSEQETTLDITLSPHYYETLWFRTLVAISVLSILALYIHSRRRQFLLLSDREERLGAIVNSLHESAILVYDRRGTVTALWGTEQLDRRYALAEVDAVGMRLDEFLPADQAADICNEINQVFDTGQGRLATHFVSFPGGEFWHEASYAPMQDNHGKTIAVVAFVRDITDRKRAEGALRQSEARLRALFETSVDAIILSTRDGSLIAANPAAHTLYGYDQGEMVGVHASQLYADPADRGRAQVELEEHGAIRSAERRLRRKDGTEFDAILSATLRRSPAGEIIGYQAIVHDVSERKRAEDTQRQLEEQLRHAQKMDAVGTLAAGVAHDFNNYLMAIIGYSYKADASTQGNQAATEAVGGIREAAQQAATLTRSLLSFSRNEGLRAEPTNLVAVVNEAVALVRHGIPAAVEVVSQTPTDEQVWVEGDATQLRQLVVNLALNARDAMPDGGCLQINIEHESQALADSAQEEKKYATLVVCDNGLGMTKEVASRIFDPFFTTKTRERGTGLGMAVVHRVVQNHNGRIDVDSAPGRGTCMTVDLPMCDPPVGTPDMVEHDDAPADSSIHAGKRILLAEDNPHVRPLLVSSLEEAGYDVIVAADGKEALKAIRSRFHEIDFLVLDVDLPFAPGTECLQVARQLAPDIPAILISGLSESQDKAEQLGATLLSKPFVIKDLIAAIDSSLSQSKLTR